MIVEAANGGNSQRPTWSKGTEFLMSCIALSVGLGNIWRFPFTAYENGGATFLVVYLFVLLFVGKSFYFLEMIVGQFPSRGSINALQVIPLMKGVAFGQQIASATITSYYSSIIALTLFYFIQSFQSVLPWTVCLEKYGPNCAPSNLDQKFGNTSRSSTELYFYQEVMKQKDDISDGIGFPDSRLTLCLFASWCCVFLSIIKSVKSSGKLSYFFALFPYVVLITLLIKACTLEGSLNGMIFFIKPDLSKIFNPVVWYNAVVQLFFSLSVGTGTVLMYSGYNKFERNIYKDAMIVSIIDSCTSLLAGFTIFAILGNLAHNLGVEDISKVVKGGHGLAFFSFPEAISKMNYWYWPQIMSVIFFFMIFVLGVGSAVGLLSNLTTNLHDVFPKVKYWKIALVCSICGFLIGLIYITQGGLYILSLADYFGGTMLVFFLATFEIIGIFWIYGLENFCWDAEFMLQRRISMFWRFSWLIVIPFFMISISIYLAITMKNPKMDNEKEFPTYALICGWGLLIFGLLQIILWIIVSYVRVYSIWNNKISFISYLTTKSDKWRPKSSETNEKWESYRYEIEKRKLIYIQKHKVPWLIQKWWIITGNYPDGVTKGIQKFS